MRRSVALASLLALVLALGAPAVPAVAQNAGDDQYQDPFGGSGGGGSGKGSGTTSGSQGTPSTPSPSSGTTSSGTTSSGSSGTSGTTSAGSTTPSATTTPSSTTSATAASSTSSELPRTGGDPGLVALFGAGLVLTGAGLRARARVIRG